MDKNNDTKMRSEIESFALKHGYDAARRVAREKGGPVLHVVPPEKGGAGDRFNNKDTKKSYY